VTKSSYSKFPPSIKRDCPPALARYVVPRTARTAVLIDQLCALDITLDILKHKRAEIEDRLDEVLNADE
jgi:hypothetical protein